MGANDARSAGPVMVPWPVAMQIADDCEANGYHQLAREARKAVWLEAARLASLTEEIRMAEDYHGEMQRAGVAPPTGRWLDRLARSHEAPGAHVVELHLSFGGKAQVSALPDNTGFLIRVFPPGAPHEEGGGAHTDLSVVIRYDEALRTVIKGLHFTPRADDA